jgi:hypothetical protein
VDGRPAVHLRRRASTEANGRTQAAICGSTSGRSAMSEVDPWLALELAGNQIEHRRVHRRPDRLRPVRSTAASKASTARRTVDRQFMRRSAPLAGLDTAPWLPGEVWPRVSEASRRAVCAMPRDGCAPRRDRRR